MPESIEDLVRTVYAALRTGDKDTLADALAPAFVVYFAEGMPAGGGRADGPAQAIEHWWAIGRMFAVHPAPEEIAALADGRLMVRGRYIGHRRSDGRRIEADFIHLWTATDGSLTELRQLTDTARW